MVAESSCVFARRPTSSALAFLFICAAASRLLAADPLANLPADACGIVIFPHIEKTLERFSEFARAVNPDFERIELDDFEEAMNLEGGTIDPTQPVAVILTRPMFGSSSAMIAFVPRDPEEFKSLVEEGHGGPVAYEGHEDDGFAMLRDGVGYYAQNKRAFRLLRGARKPLLGDLNSRQKKMLQDCDFFMHIPLARWREEKINPMFAVATGLLRLSVASNETPADPENSAHVMDSLIEGARRILDDMESATFALTIQDSTLRLQHHHRFDPACRTAEYINQVQYTGGDLFAELPDDPFMIAMTTNWKNTSAEPLTTRICRTVCELPSAAGKIDPDTRKKLLDTLNKCYGQIDGGYMLMGPAAQGRLPMQMFGGYIMKDAALGMEQFKFIHENAGEALSAILPGAGCASKFKRIQKDGLDIMEMPMGDEAMRAQFRQQMDLFYGKGARYQKTTPDSKHLDYYMGQPPETVKHIVDARKTGRVLRKNPAVQRVVDRFPEKANACILADVGILMSLAPDLAEMHDLPKKATTTAVSPPPGPVRSGPIIGWALQLEKNACTGTLAVDAADLASFTNIARSQTRKSVPRPPRAVRIRRPPPPPGEPNRD